MTKPRAAIILAAGKGKRMKSDLPKVLHTIDGKPIICYLLETMSKVNMERIIVVVGYQGEKVIDKIRDFNTEIVWQKDQLGTGHAVMMAEGNFRKFTGTILIAAGDVPFLSVETIENLFEGHKKNKAVATCLSAEFDDPTGYGRIIRGKETDSLNEIIEEKDADSEVKKIKEINSGTFCFDCQNMFKTLHRANNDNAQKEFYLTDTIKLLRQIDKKCAVWKVPDPFEIQGVNSIEQLKSLEKEMKSRKKMIQNQS
jgi:bifunctional UDP-N-acetylglucosamine pyrophosphorylase/glucosamine-1-phosphate N-acetyltransferase